MADPPQCTAWPGLGSPALPSPKELSRAGEGTAYILLPTCFATPVLRPPPPAHIRPAQKYIPDCCNAIWAVLEEMAKTTPHGPKRRRLEQATDVMEKVRVCVGGGWAGGEGMTVHSHISPLGRQWALYSRDWGGSG